MVDCLQDGIGVIGQYGWFDVVYVGVDLFDDGIGIFGVWVVVGQYDLVGLFGDLVYLWVFVWIVIVVVVKYVLQLVVVLGGDLVQGGQGFVECVGCMCVIDYDQWYVGFVKLLYVVWCGQQCGGCSDYGILGYVLGQQYVYDVQYVVDIEMFDQLGFDLVVVERGIDMEGSIGMVVV